MPVVPSEVLERAATLHDGIGLAHDTVTTSNLDAQRFYDQGLAYLHNFAWIEAARSFHQARRVDPQLALAYVGLSVAYVELNQPDAAHETLAKATALSSRASAHDRWHIRIRERQLAAEGAPDDPAKMATFRATIDEALRQFPSDVELLLQRGVAAGRDPADRGQGSPAASIPFYERALKLSPNYFATHHYLTHAFENTGRFQDAVRHGRQYATLAAKVPHARHMYGHNLRRLGQIEAAITEFEEADRLHAAFTKAEGLRPEYDWHVEHNLDLLATSYQYSGRMKKAEASYRGAFQLPTFNLVQAVQKRQWPQFLRSRGRLDEALIASRVLIDHPHPVVKAAGHIEAGRTMLARRQTPDAARELQLALAAIKGAAGGGLVALSLEHLQGELLLRSGQREQGRRLLEAMVQKARALNGPDEWSDAIFALEATCRAARDIDDWPFADRLARQMAEHDPMFPGARYALALVAERRGDVQLASEEFALAQKYWSRADPDLPELTEIRKRLGR